MNHAWETYEFTPILSKSHLISKNEHYCDDWAKCLSTICYKRKSIWNPSKYSRVYGKTKDLSSKCFWFNAMNHLRRCNIIRQYAIVGNTPGDNEVHMTSQKCAKCYVWLVVNIWYENLKKKLPVKLFLRSLKEYWSTAFFFAPGHLNIDAQPIWLGIIRIKLLNNTIASFLMKFQNYLIFFFRIVDW